MIAKQKAMMLGNHDFLLSRVCDMDWNVSTALETIFPAGLSQSGS